MNKKKILTVAMVFCLAVALICGGLLAAVLIVRHQQAAAAQQLSQQVAQQRQEAAETAASVVSEPQILPWLGALYAQNPHLAGWLSLPGCNIDGPVVVDPPEEPEYYLHRAFDGSYSYAGTFFIGSGAGTESDCLIIYGHNMAGGTMFGKLSSYSNPDFFRANSTFTFASLTEEKQFRIFSVVQTRLLKQNEEGFRYYNTVGALTRQEFDALTAWLAENSMVDGGDLPTYGQQIVILSTCSYHTEDGRFLIAGVVED